MARPSAVVWLKDAFTRSYRLKATFNPKLLGGRDWLKDAFTLTYWPKDAFTRLCGE